jgi:hypothetical protein
MSKKIIGVTVGSSLPKPNFKQTDPTKGDYIRNKPDFDGLKDKVNTVSGLVGDTAVAEQINTAFENYKASWNDLTEKPTEFVGGITINGPESTDGLEFYSSFYKVSDFVPTIDYFENGFKFKAINEQEEKSYTVNDLIVGDMFWPGSTAIRLNPSPYFIVMLQDTTSPGGSPTISKGIYFMKTSSIAHTLTINGKEVIRKDYLNINYNDLADKPVHSWDNLIDRPTRYETAVSATWDGNTDIYEDLIENGAISGSVRISESSYSDTIKFYQVSDEIPGIEDFKNGYIVTTVDGETYTLTDENLYNIVKPGGDLGLCMNLSVNAYSSFYGSNNIISTNPYLLVVNETMTSGSNIYKAPKGIYFAENVRSLIINGKEVIKDEYISNDIARVKDIPDSVHVQNEAPIDVAEGALWLDMDEETNSQTQGLPPYTTEDEGKFLRIVNGIPTWVTIPKAEDGVF